MGRIRHIVGELHCVAKHTDSARLVSSFHGFKVLGNFEGVQFWGGDTVSSASIDASMHRPITPYVLCVKMLYPIFISFSHFLNHVPLLSHSPRDLIVAIIFRPTYVFHAPPLIHIHISYGCVFLSMLYAFYACYFDVQLNNYGIKHTCPGVSLSLSPFEF